MPGLLRYHEVEVAHRVTHAIRFTTDVTDRRHIWPARHDAGSVSSHNYPPMGARFRLRAGFDISHYRRDTQAVLRAMKHYGLILADNGSPWYFQGSADKRWPTRMLDQLKGIPARAFYAVDTSRMKVGSAPGRRTSPSRPRDRPVLRVGAEHQQVVAGDVRRLGVPGQVAVLHET